MKLLQGIEAPKKGLLIGLALLLVTVIPLIIFKTSSSSNCQLPRGPRRDQEDPTTAKESCNIFKGEWVPNPKGPYYTNTTCFAIHEHQNCIKYGRPDSEFMSWRWKPHGSIDCQLPIFDPLGFFEIVRGKSMAFVGDSIAMNQMQSLICLLSRVEYPVDKSPTKDYYFKKWHYKSYNFTLSIYTSPYLVKSSMEDPNGPTGNGIFGVHLDEADPSWVRHINSHNYLIISAGPWFLPSIFYYNQTRLLGCRFCGLQNVTQLPIPLTYRAVFRTAFQAILDRNNAFHGTVFLRTLAPAHFEGGDWNSGGDCVRRKPFASNETMLQGMYLDMYRVQVEEFRVAEKRGRERGVEFRLLDTTQATLLRPDGHPSKYGHWPDQKVVMVNDCVHWCLPGPIDAWNDFLFEMMRTEGEANGEKRKS